jgi:hypothetical protein
MSWRIERFEFSRVATAELSQVARRMVALSAPSSAGVIGIAITQCVSTYKPPAEPGAVGLNLLLIANEINVCSFFRATLLRVDARVLAAA